MVLGHQSLIAPLFLLALFGIIPVLSPMNHWPERCDFWSDPADWQHVPSDFQTRKMSRLVAWKLSACWRGVVNVPLVGVDDDDALMFLLVPSS